MFQTFFAAQPRARPSGRGYGGFHVRKQPEVLIEARTLKNHPHAFLRAGEEENAAFQLQALHGADQDREAGTVDVRNIGEINNEPLWFLVVDDRAQGRAQFRRNVEIDRAFGGENTG